MENATTKLGKRTFTIVEKACHEINGFQKLYEELQDKIVLSGQSKSTLSNYARKMAQISLHFRKLPQHISEKEMNRYLANLARKSKTPSLSDFKFTIYGLRYCYHLLGMNEKAVKLPHLRQERKLPVVLNYQECIALFKAPELLKHRVLLSLIYSAGLRAQEASHLKIADIDSGLMMIHIRQSKYHKDRCDQCGHIRISYNSCRNRHCPKCQNTQREAWIENRKRDLIPVPYFHVVFTVPDKLNSLFLHDPPGMYNLLLRTVWQTLVQFSWTNLHAETGMIAVLHTWVYIPYDRDLGSKPVAASTCALYCPGWGN